MVLKRVGPAGRCRATPHPLAERDVLLLLLLLLLLFVLLCAVTAAHEQMWLRSPAQR